MGLTKTAYVSPLARVSDASYDPGTERLVRLWLLDAAIQQFIFDTPGKVRHITLCHAPSYLTYKRGGGGGGYGIMQNWTGPCGVRY